MQEYEVSIVLTSELLANHVKLFIILLKAFLVSFRMGCHILFKNVIFVDRVANFKFVLCFFIVTYNLDSLLNMILH